MREASTTLIPSRESWVPAALENRTSRSGAAGICLRTASRSVPKCGEAGSCWGEAISRQTGAGADHSRSRRPRPVPVRGPGIFLGLVTDNRGLEERSWYHQHGFADPRDADSEGGPYRSSPPAPPRRRFRGHWQLSRRRQPAPLRPRHRKTGTVDGHSSVEDAAFSGVPLARRSNRARPPENLDLTRGCGCAQR